MPEQLRLATGKLVLMIGRDIPIIPALFIKGEKVLIDGKEFTITTIQEPEPMDPRMFDVSYMFDGIIFYDDHAMDQKDRLHKKYSQVHHNHKSIEMHKRYNAIHRNQPKQQRIGN